MNLSPFGVVEYLVLLWWTWRSPRDCSWERYLWSIAHDKLALYITCVLVCGCIHKLSISAVISEFERFTIEITRKSYPYPEGADKNIPIKIIKILISNLLYAQTKILGSGKKSKFQNTQGSLNMGVSYISRCFHVD